MYIWRLEGNNRKLCLLRGGSWINTAGNSRVANRNNNNGFGLVFGLQLSSVEWIFGVVNRLLSGVPLINHWQQI